MLIATALLLASTALNPAQQADEDEMTLAEQSALFESDLFGTQDQDSEEIAAVADAVTVQPEEEADGQIYYTPVWKTVR